MELEKKTAQLLSQKEELKKKGNYIRLFAAAMMIVILASYVSDFYVIPVCIACIVIAFATFFMVGLPIQKKLYKVSKELKTFGEV